jgi:hypothetical protein
MQDQRRPEYNDRRVIERFSEPRVRSVMEQIRTWLKILAGMCCLVAAGIIADGVLRGIDAIPAGIFVGTFLIMFAVLLFQYSVSIDFYLKNESVNNLSSTFERQLMLWKTTGILSALILAIYLILRI